MGRLNHIIYKQILTITHWVSATQPALAQFPTKPVRTIAASIGTSGDLLARYLGQRLSERWSDSNKTGG